MQVKIAALGLFDSCACTSLAELDAINALLGMDLYPDFDIKWNGADVARHYLWRPIADMPRERIDDYGCCSLPVAVGNPWLPCALVAGAGDVDLPDDHPCGPGGDACALLLAVSRDSSLPVEQRFFASVFEYLIVKDQLNDIDAIVTADNSGYLAKLLLLGQRRVKHPADYDSLHSIVLASRAFLVAGDNNPMWAECNTARRVVYTVVSRGDVAGFFDYLSGVDVEELKAAEELLRRLGKVSY